MSTRPAVHILRWIDAPNAQSLTSQIDAIFCHSSGTQSFADGATRAAFRERWLGRYLAGDAGHVWLALDGNESVAGYLAGCLSDPARGARFADLGYFPLLSAETAVFPAHLHINLDPQWRGVGIGSKLIEAFASDLARHGVAGVHVVTGAGMRNVGFYTRNRFQEVRRFPWNGRELVMLGRRVTSDRSPTKRPTK